MNLFIEKSWQQGSNFREPSCSVTKVVAWLGHVAASAASLIFSNKKPGTNVRTERLPILAPRSVQW